MATLLDICVDALVDIGALAAGDTAPAEDADGAMRAMNRLVDQWAAERFMIHTITRNSWTITSGTGAYTVGSGGDVDIARPMFTDHVSYSDSGNDDNEVPLIKLTDDEYYTLIDKAATAPTPRYWYYNPSFPLATLTLFDYPTSSTLTGYLYAPTAVTEFTSLAQTVSLPPGYRRMLVKNLAIELAPSYGRQVTRELVTQANESMAVIRRSNDRDQEMRIESGYLGNNGGGYDIYTEV